MMNHSSSEPRDEPGAFRVWANAHGEFAGPEQALARALAAIEATADLTWWDLVNYHGAWS